MAKSTKASERALVEVLTEMGKTPIKEAYISDKNNFIEGELDGKVIVVNPVHSMVDTIIHEVLHKLHPMWSEKSVRNRTTWLIRRLSDDEQIQIYREYNKRKTGKI